MNQGHSIPIGDWGSPPQPRPMPLWHAHWRSLNMLEATRQKFAARSKSYSHFRSTERFTRSFGGIPST